MPLELANEIEGQSKNCKEVVRNDCGLRALGEHLYTVYGEQSQVKAAEVELKCTQ